MKHMRPCPYLLLISMCLPVHAQLAADQVQHWKRIHESKTSAFEEFNDAKFGLFHSLGSVLAIGR